MRLRRLALMLGLAASMCAPALSQEADFGAFALMPDEPGAAMMVGRINPSAPLDLRRMLKDNPNVEMLALHSEGGDVTASLLVAEEIRSRGLDTYVPEGAECVSACAFVFFAGKQRLNHGKVGVHQVYGAVQDDYSTQIAVADILDSFRQSDVPEKVVSDMLRTPPASMRTYDADEAEQLGLNRITPGSPLEMAAEAVRPSPTGTLPRAKDRYDLGDGWVEEVHQIPEAMTLEQAFFRMGMVRSEFAPFGDMIRRFLKSDTAPAWTEFTVLFPPDRPRYPMRMMVSTPASADGRITPLVTVERVANGKVKVMAATPQTP